MKHRDPARFSLTIPTRNQSRSPARFFTQSPLTPAHLTQRHPLPAPGWRCPEPGPRGGDQGSSLGQAHRRPGQFGGRARCFMGACRDHRRTVRSGRTVTTRSPPHPSRHPVSLSRRTPAALQGRTVHR